MEEIKLWTIDCSHVEDLNPAGHTETEKLLEDTIVRRPEMLLEDLTLVGRQTPTEGGPLDLLGVDGDGRLVVFELKRGILSRDAVAQVIDYASDLDGMDLDTLADYISQKSGNRGIQKIEDFHDWYSQTFEGEELKSLKPIRMFLVGLGVDDRTERMVRFLAENSGMDISLLTFYGFRYLSKTILAKRVKVDSSKDSTIGPRISNEERWKLLNDLVDEYGISEMHKSLRDMFKKNWPESHQIPVRHKNPPYGKSINVKFSSNTYVRIDPWDGGMGLAFYRWSVALDADAFREPIKDIRYNTWPKNRALEDDPLPEVYFKWNLDEWETHKEKLTGLVQSLYEAWQNSG